MMSGTKITIELINGFELFNTRAYHNYETWSDGWKISDGNITVKGEDLDDAVNIFVKKHSEYVKKITERITGEKEDESKVKES
jgi:hypothetical protein